MSIFAAAVPPKPLLVPSTKISPEIIILLVAIGVIVLLIVVWAVFFRRSPDELGGWGPGRSSHSYKPQEETGGSGSRRHRKWRRRRREHRPRNPTLSETGGLPPARSDDSETAP